MKWTDFLSIDQSQWLNCGISEVVFACCFFLWCCRVGCRGDATALNFPPQSARGMQTQTRQPLHQRDTELCDEKYHNLPAPRLYEYFPNSNDSTTPKQIPHPWYTPSITENKLLHHKSDQNLLIKAHWLLVCSLACNLHVWKWKSESIVWYPLHQSQSITHDTKTSINIKLHNLSIT